MASQLDICNEALGLIGEMPIDDIDDTTDPKAIRCKQFWETSRDQLLERFPWLFATKRSALAIDAVDPEYGFEYAYTLPSDCLRVLCVSTDGREDDETSTTEADNYRVEHGRILSDDDELYVKYVARVEETGRYSPLFGAALSALLASKVGVSMAKSAAVIEMTMKLYTLRLSEASRSENAQTGTVRSGIVSSWRDAR